jgi:hypothetical protein
MKTDVTRRRVDTQDELLYHIMDVFAHIWESEEALRDATCHVAKCTDFDSGIFKNVLY